MSPTVRYIRGDHLLRPTYSLSFSKDVVDVGDEVTATVTVMNPSGQVALEEGSVSLDLGSLLGRLEPASATTLPLGAVGARGRRTYDFQLRALQQGNVAVQAAVQGLWESPVPRGVTFEGPAASARSLRIIESGASARYAAVFELEAGSGKLAKKTGAWSLKVKGLYKPGRPLFEEDLGSIDIVLGDNVLFAPASGAVTRARVDRKTGGVTKISLADGNKNKVTLDLRKGKLALTVKRSGGLDLTQDVSLGIAIGDTGASLRSPTELRAKKQDKAVLLPATGEFRRGADTRRARAAAGARE